MSPVCPACDNVMSPVRPVLLGAFRLSSRDSLRISLDITLLLYCISHCYRPSITVARVDVLRFAGPPQPLYKRLPRFLYKDVLLRLKERLLAQYTVIVIFASVFNIDSLRKVTRFSL